MDKKSFNEIGLFTMVFGVLYLIGRFMLPNLFNVPLYNVLVLYGLGILNIIARYVLINLVAKYNIQQRNAMLIRNLTLLFSLLIYYVLT
jgi:ABC-type uncharacterized transport system permease subunit